VRDCIIMKCRMAWTDGQKNGRTNIRRRHLLSVQSAKSRSTNPISSSRLFRIFFLRGKRTMRTRKTQHAKRKERTSKQKHRTRSTKYLLAYSLKTTKQRIITILNTYPKVIKCFASCSPSWDQETVLTIQLNLVGDSQVCLPACPPSPFCTETCPMNVCKRSR
jgi:hypothetical protein